MKPYHVMRTELKMLSGKTTLSTVVRDILYLKFYPTLTEHMV